MTALAEDFARLARLAGADLHLAIAKRMAPHGGRLRCIDCGTVGPNLDAAAFADYLRDGWPTCCSCGNQMVVDVFTADGVVNEQQVLRDYDRELAALDACVKGFESVDEAARGRMLQYLNQRYC